jgi:hypothetical protein
MADQTAETKPKIETGSAINLVVKDQNQTEVIAMTFKRSPSVVSSVGLRPFLVFGQVHFKVKTHTKFQRIIEAYAGKKSVDPTAIRFAQQGRTSTYLPCMEWLRNHLLVSFKFVDFLQISV